MKHRWKKDHNGEVDTWAWERDFHNGPVCEVCGYAVCENCNPDWMNLDDCTGPRIKTNEDHILSMRGEELASFLDDIISQGCVCPARDCRSTCLECVTEWLAEPYKGDE